MSSILQTIFTFLLPGWKDEPPLLPSNLPPQSLISLVPQGSTVVLEHGIHWYKKYNLSPQSLISLVPRGSTVVLEHGTSLVQEVLWSTKFLKISFMAQLEEIFPTTR